MASLIELKGWHDIKKHILQFLDAEARREAALVCKDFYETICHLELDKSLKLDKKIMNDEIYESMLHTSRRFKEITVFASYKNKEALAIRLGAILGKFKSHAKKIVFHGFWSCSRAASLPIVEAMSDVEEVSLFLTNTIYESAGILDGIPDNAVTSFSLKLYDDEPRPNEERLQRFLNRQTKLKKLEFPEGLKLELGHLELEELALYVDDGFMHDDDYEMVNLADDDWLAAELKQQLSLRVFRCGSIGTRSRASIGSSSFKELQKLSNLEFLRGSFVKNMRGHLFLANLKELRVSGDASFLLQVTFPKLKTFKLIEGSEQDWEWQEILQLPSQRHSLGPEHIIALSRSAQNLQVIEIKNNTIDYLPAIIESFPNLDTLILEPLADGDLNFPPPTRQNLSLKQLIIERQVFGHETPDADIYQTIAMCPNLERICLSDIVFSEHEILNLIESHTRLTHFIFGSVNENNLFSEQGDDSLDPNLQEIINVFRNSQAFVLLSFDNIAFFEDQLVEDALAGDEDRIEIRKSNDDSYACFELLSKNVKNDPWKDFYRKQISDDF